MAKSCSGIYVIKGTNITKTQGGKRGGKNKSRKSTRKDTRNRKA